MSQRFLKLCSLITLLALGACATYGTWKPLVDTARDPKVASLEQDYAECKQMADKASDMAGTTAERGVLGALAGAAGGAALGAITGSAGMGAAIGAATGATGGAASGALSEEEAYKSAYASCMRNRGHPVVQ